MIEIMGIVNVTPDSFSDGGLYLSPAAAIAHGLGLLRQGADILDIGGESTRPGAAPVTPREEIARIIPVIEGLVAPARQAGVPISVDTRNADTMQAAVAAGATIINDVSALTHDPRSLEIAAAGSSRVVLMHMAGTPKTMQEDPVYADVVAEVRDWLGERLAIAQRAGIARSRLAIDPGIGFGKTLEHNLLLLQGLPALKALGVPVMVGVSRKQMIARLSRGEPAYNRLGGSLAAALFAAAQGADILRVHDVAETAQALKIWLALREAPHADPMPS